MSSSKNEDPTREDIQAACVAIGRLLSGKKYAIIGGGALQLLESPRLTMDVDILVPKNTIKVFRSALAAAKY
jgi:hypothetical protein